METANAIYLVAQGEVMNYTHAVDYGWTMLAIMALIFMGIATLWKNRKR